MFRIGIKSEFAMKTLALIVAILMFCVAGNAQNRMLGFGFGGGIAIPTDDAADYSKIGFDGFVNGMLSFSSSFNAGVILGYASFPSKMVDTLNLPNTVVRAFLLRGAYTFTSEQRIHPYIAAFGGLYHTKINKCLTVTGNEVVSVNITDSSYGYGVEDGVRRGNISVGVAYYVVGFDFKYVLVNVGYSLFFKIR